MSRPRPPFDPERDSRACELCGAMFYRKQYRTGGNSRCSFERRRYCSVVCSWDAQAIAKYGVTLKRIQHVLRHDPDLEAWQLCERFGVDVSTAQGWREKYLGKARAHSREKVSV